MKKSLIAFSLSFILISAGLITASFYYQQKIPFADKVTYLESVWSAELESGGRILKVSFLKIGFDSLSSDGTECVNEIRSLFLNDGSDEYLLNVEEFESTDEANWVCNIDLEQGSECIKNCANFDDCIKSCSEEWDCSIGNPTFKCTNIAPDESCGIKKIVSTPACTDGESGIGCDKKLTLNFDPETGTLSSEGTLYGNNPIIINKQAGFISLNRFFSSNSNKPCFFQSEIEATQ